MVLRSSDGYFNLKHSNSNPKDLGDLPKDLSQPRVIPNEHMRKLRVAPWNLGRDLQAQELLHLPLHLALRVGRGCVETWGGGLWKGLAGFPYQAFTPTLH